jgi:hypothetical protein
MGMSDDLEAAIMEGATIVRIGTAIFGQREYRRHENHLHRRRQHGRRTDRRPAPAGLLGSRIQVVEPSAESRDKLAESFGVRCTPPSMPPP